MNYPHDSGSTCRIAALMLTMLTIACAGGPNPPAEDPSQEDAASPDYEVIFTGRVGDTSEIFGMNVSGGIRQQLTTLTGFADFPVWSPDGDNILFLAMGDETSDLTVMDAATGEMSVVVAGNSNPADWGPTGERILITAGVEEGGRGLFIVDVRDGSMERVSTGSSEDAYARWSPAGDAVTYESGRDGNPEIYWTSLETGETLRLTENQLLDEWPSFSPDGSRIAWASGGEEDKNLWIMRADGTDKQQVTTGLMFGDAFPEWSSDGRQILLTVREGDQFVLQLIDIETGEATHLGPGTAPSWR
jgi:Tol biopolymer transport system component